MKEEITYNPQDIEDLLLNKSFDELDVVEKEFALTQVESEQEYNEMRVTLISVKQIAAEEETVYVPNKIKEDLMQLMEKKSKPFGWLSLNAIGGFLFPSNTPLFKKPGLQFATVALMFLLVLNIGFDFAKQPQKEIALNTTTQTEQIEKIIETESKEKEVVIKKDVLKSPIENILNNSPKAPAVVELQDETGYYKELDKANEEILDKVVIITDNEDVLEDALVIEEPKVASVPLSKVGRIITDVEVVADMEEEISVAKDVKSNHTAVTFNANSADLNNVSLRTVVISSEKSKKINPIKLKSQNLENNSEVIDLLFVAL
ncbi:hypothetical protein N9544_02585 [Flavobacteriales bacterium]|nr:hypothetical protein [Flavobacteriales bacterium]